MWINIKTEFTFNAVYGHLDKIAAKCKTLGNCAGIADIGNTFGHIRWRKACKKANIKPIYGVVLPVLEDPELKERRIAVNNMTFIARTTEGLQEIYNLVDLAHKQFYYKQRVSYNQVNALSEGVFVLSGVAPRWDLIERTVYQELGPHIPYCHRDLSDHPVIACIDNFYPNVEDKIVYEPFADARLKEDKSYSLHIPTKIEWLANFPGREDALINLEKLTTACNVVLPNAPMVKYIGTDDVRTWCHRGAGERGISITSDGPYKDRYEREIKLIIDKDYADYFLVVADLIRYAKTKMAVGHGRGSSSGSLVCYLMHITEVDPLEYDLYFERFIDAHRLDMPDIDIDFQDNKRYLVFKYLQKKYGEECVSNIGNISTLKPKSAIDRFAKALSIPLEDIKELKDSIMERSGGDARANDCIEDSINDTDVGKRFIEKYPAMKVVSKIEAHCSHTSVHAAGILVCNDPITKYAGVNSRDKEKDGKRIAMLDKKDAEAINLLKIDALGLRTLTILAGVCDQIGKPYGWLYDIPVDDELTYKVFNDHRFNGIFQFEGPAIKGLAKQMPIVNMEDISALSALGRPGPLNSGGANRYIKYRSGKDIPKYASNHKAFINATKNTFGIVVYQEQMLQISREYGKLSWKDTGDLRKAASKSLGDEFFGKFRDKFIKGALTIGESEEDAKAVWDTISTSGSWAFNKSHSVAYGLISYLCAYFKAHYPLEFTVSCLNHAKEDSSALKILRDAVEHDGIQYKHIDKDLSTQKWSVQDDILLGGLTTIHGIGPANANKIVKFRYTDETLPKGIRDKLEFGVSNFKYLYPGKQLYGDYYKDPQSHGLDGIITHIKDTDKNGMFTIIGCMIKKNLRDANEACFVTKRKGVYETGLTAWLNLTLEDDTDSLMCKIPKDKYERLGRIIAETGKTDKDWYMVHGEKINGWSLLFVKNIMKITREI